MTTTMTLHVANAALDGRCKTTLNKMLQNGWTKANIAYQTTQQTLTTSELSHLLKHGGLVGTAGPIGCLKSFSTPKFGPQAGVDIAFQLNVDLV